MTRSDGCRCRTPRQASRFALVYMSTRVRGCWGARVCAFVWAVFTRQPRTRLGHTHVTCWSKIRRFSASDNICDGATARGTCKNRAASCRRLPTIRSTCSRNQQGRSGRMRGRIQDLVRSGDLAELGAGVTHSNVSAPQHTLCTSARRTAGLRACGLTWHPGPCSCRGGISSIAFCTPS